MSSLGRGIGASLLSGTWLAVLSFVLAPLYVHLLGIESYGLIGLYTAALAIGGILDVTLSATASREIAWLLARSGERQRIGTLLRSIEVVYWLSVLSLLLLLLLAIAVSGESLVKSSSLSADQLKGATVLMALSLAIQLPCGLYAASLIGMHKQARSAAIVAGFGTARGIGTVLVAWGVSDDIRAFFAWHVAAGVLQVIWVRWQAWSYVRMTGGRTHFTLEALASIKNAAGAMFLITAMGTMLSQMDKIVLGFLVSLESLGHYAMAWSLAGGLSILATPVVQGFSVRFSTLAADGDYPGLARQIHRASQLTYVLIIPPAMTISLFAEQIMNAWVRDAVVAAAAAPALPLLALGTALVSCIYPLLHAMYAQRQFKPVLIVQFVCLIVFTPLLLFLVSFGGILGAAWCWAIYGAALFVSYVVLVAGSCGNQRLLARLLKSFFAVTGVSVAINWSARFVAGEAVSDLLLLGAMGVVLAGGWLAAILVCADMRLGFATRISAAARFVRDR